MHAVPGAGPATLTANGTAVGGPVEFGAVGDYGSAAGGSVKLALKGADGKTLATSDEDLSGKRFTVVATKADGGLALRAYKDGGAKGGSARLRAVHAAPELGAVTLSVDDREVDGPLEPGKGSAYETVEPGTYEIKAMRATGKGAPLASLPGTTLTAGTADTAFIVGSGGEPTRIVLASDGTAAPGKGPASGLGDLSGHTAWLAALGAALAAGALGGGAYALVSRRNEA